MRPHIPECEQKMLLDSVKHCLTARFQRAEGNFQAHTQEDCKVGC